MRNEAGKISRGHIIKHLEVEMTVERWFWVYQGKKEKTSIPRKGGHIVQAHSTMKALVSKKHLVQGAKI